MSGILDNKSRIIDAMLTVEGRRQMAAGTFEVSYVTFSDADVVYIPDSVNGHEDPTNRIYFEACNLPQDQITFEANDEGNLVPFRIQDIKLSNQGGNIPTTSSEGTLRDGRLTMYQYHHGRRIKVDTIFEVKDDDGKGFIYSDSTGVMGSVLIKSNLSAGIITSSVSVGGPYIAYLGTRGGMGPQQFARVISGAISQLRSLGGPDVQAMVSDSSVYLDVGGYALETKIFSTGTLSSPLLIEGPSVGGRLLEDEIQNAGFASQIEGVLTSSFDNFVQLQTLASINRLFDDQEFIASTNEITYDLSRVENKLTKAFRKSPPSVNSIDSLFSDDKLSHLDNFKYLPPIVKTSDSTVADKSDITKLTNYFLGDYPSWGDNEKKLNYEGIMKQLSEFNDSKRTITFNSSMKNNLVGQFFEILGDRVTKLDVVDFGDVMDPKTKLMNKVYFVGKTFLDNRGTVCYVNMFTLIFSSLPVEGSELR